MRRQRCNDFIQTVPGGVVQQDSPPHAPVGGFEQFIDQRPSAQAVMDDVVLQVQAALGVTDQFGPSHESLGAVGQQAKPRTTLVRRGLSHDRATERGIGGWQRLARPIIRHGGMRAAAQAQGQSQKEGQCPFVRQRAHPEVKPWRYDRMFCKRLCQADSAWAINRAAAAPTLRTASSILGVGLAAKFIRKQFLYLPEAEKMLPTAICTPCPSSARFRRKESKSSGSSTHSMNPPWGRLTRVPSGK